MTGWRFLVVSAVSAAIGWATIFAGLLVAYRLAERWGLL